MVTTRSGVSAPDDVVGVEKGERLSSSSPSTMDMLLTPYYALTLVLRAICIILPGFLQSREFLDGQEAVYAMFFGLTPNATVDLPVEMTGTSPTMSIVPPLITSFVPYAVVSYLGQVDPILAFLIPRVWMLLISIVIDVLTLQCFNSVSGAGRESAFFLLMTSWATLVMYIRPINAVVETLALAGLLYSILGISNDVQRMVAFSFFFTLGIFCRPSFMVYGGVLIFYVITAATKPNAKLVPLIVGTILATATFLVVILVFACIDSFYYGKLVLTVGETAFANLSEFVRAVSQGTVSFADIQKHISTDMKLVIAPLNAFSGVTMSNFRALLQKSFAPGQLFFYFPLVAGPIAVVLGMETWDSLKKMYREVLAQFRGSTGKKKKTRKVPEAAKAREEETMMFADLVEMALTLGISGEVLFGAKTTGLGAVLPSLIPAVLMLQYRFLGPKAIKNMKKYWVAYNVLAVVFFGLLHNGGVIRSALSMAQGEQLIEGTKQPVTVFYYNTYTPPNYLLGDNLHGVKFYSLENATNSERVYNKVSAVMGREENEGRAAVVMCPATTPLDESKGFSRIGQIGWHMSLDHFPKNIDAIFKKSRLQIYSVNLEEPTEQAVDTDEESDYTTEKADEEEKEL